MANETPFVQQRHTRAAALDDAQAMGREDHRAALRSNPSAQGSLQNETAVRIKPVKRFIQ